MSVAFRRESDEEHREPRFELPLPPGPNIVTRRGLALIRQRVDELQALVAREPEEATKRDLRYWHTRLATAMIAPLPRADQVAFGSRVRFSLDGAERTIDIVGSDEAEPASGRIGFAAPLARALIGAGVDDLVDFGGDSEAIRILAIDPIPE